MSKIFKVNDWDVMFRSFSTVVMMLFLIVAGPLLTACSGSNGENSALEKADTKAVSEVTLDKRLGAEDIPDEVYGDAPTFNAPRLQFVVILKESGLQEIWSSRLDGTDVRRVVSAELVNSPVRGSINRPPVRSPDNRHIVYSLATEDGIKKQLIDLKEKQVEVFAVGGGIPSFQWTPDSGNIIFALVGGEYNDRVQYSLDTKIITKKKHMKNSGGVYLIPHKMHFIAMTYKGFAEYDFDGKLIREVKLAERIQTFPFYDVSRNGELVFYGDKRGSHLIRTADPKHVLATVKYSECLIHPSGIELLCLKSGNLISIDINAKQESKLLDLKPMILFMSIYNG